MHRLSRGCYHKHVVMRIFMLCRWRCSSRTKVPSARQLHALHSNAQNILPPSPQPPSTPLLLNRPPQPPLPPPLSEKTLQLLTSHPHPTPMQHPPTNLLHPPPKMFRTTQPLLVLLLIRLQPHHPPPPSTPSPRRC